MSVRMNEIKYAPVKFNEVLPGELFSEDENVQEFSKLSVKIAGIPYDSRACMANPYGIEFSANAIAISDGHLRAFEQDEDVFRYKVILT